MSLSKLELRAKVIDIIDRLNIDISDIQHQMELTKELKNLGNLELVVHTLLKELNTDDENKIQKVCELFVKIAKEGFINKTDNSVIYISTRQDSYAIPKDSILYCKSDLKYTVFVTDNGMLIRKLEKLQDVENKYLWDFMRVHQSFLINPQKVKSIDKTTNEIILSNNTRIPFSRRYSADVHDLFNN